MSQFENEPMLEMYIFETTQMLEQLENVILASEKTSRYSEEAINEVFRYMHTIKGSSAMMLYHAIAGIAHSIEDLFYYLRERKPAHYDYESLNDLVLEGGDFIRTELAKIIAGETAEGSADEIVERISQFLSVLKSQNPPDDVARRVQPGAQGTNRVLPAKDGTPGDANYFKATVFFEAGCEMAGIRAYSMIHNLEEVCEEVHGVPDVRTYDEAHEEWIKAHGFGIYMKTDQSYEQVEGMLQDTLFLKSLELGVLPGEESFSRLTNAEHIPVEAGEMGIPQMETGNRTAQDSKEANLTGHQSMISVKIEKLDKLMDLVGEMVISEAMVTQNPDLAGLDLENFHKAARQLHKITAEIQDTVMSIRMVPLSTTFLKMHRIMRDMCRKLNKNVELEVIGEETEVDKNIIEHISDPLMHLIRNAIDHGIEETPERITKGKNPCGTITLEAKNSGSEVLVIVRDDGRGLDKDKILKKAKESNLVHEHEELTDREIYNLIVLPGFSTKESITEFSGRGVGMDVVSRNLQSVGGTVHVDSTLGVGTCMTLKIPLTLAIIDGMNVKVGDSCYTIPITSIRESFRPKENECFIDPDHNEMIMVRGDCYPILRLHEHFRVRNGIQAFHEGILIIVEQESRVICLFVDELIGQQQVVVKALPNYIKHTKSIHGLAGCTLLGNGSISLILDVDGLTQLRTR